MPRPILIIFLLLFLSIILFFFENSTSPEKTGKFSFVQRAVDGDTLILASGERVRLIGIDSPEKEQPCFGESMGALKTMVSGKAVELEFDEERADKYGRTLAYLFVEGNFVNLEMVKEGFAVAFPFEPNTRYAEGFAEAEQQAREQQKGCLWNPT